MLWIESGHSIPLEITVMRSLKVMEMKFRGWKARRIDFPSGLIASSIFGCKQL